MEDLFLELSERKELSYLPETLEEAEELVALIEWAVQQETGHGVRGLKVVIDGDGIQLAGACDSFHCKQLAQHAALSVSASERLVNDIEVCDRLIAAHDR